MKAMILFVMFLNMIIQIMAQQEFDNPKRMFPSFKTLELQSASKKASDTIKLAARFPEFEKSCLDDILSWQVYDDLKLDYSNAFFEKSTSFFNPLSEESILQRIFKHLKNNC